MYDESKVQEGRTNYDIVKTIGTGTFGKVYLVLSSRARRLWTDSLGNPSR